MALPEDVTGRPSGRQNIRPRCRLRCTRNRFHCVIFQHSSCDINMSPARRTFFFFLLPSPSMQVTSARSVICRTSSAVGLGLHIHYPVLASLQIAGSNHRSSHPKVGVFNNRLRSSIRAFPALLCHHPCCNRDFIFAGATAFWRNSECFQRFLFLKVDRDFELQAAL